MNKVLKIALSIIGGMILLGIVLFMLAFAGRTSAQEVPDPPPMPQQDDNAGNFDSNAATTSSSHSKTVTEESSTSINIGGPPDPAPAMGQPGPGWGSAPNPATMVAGRWRLQAVESGDSCNITLKTEPWSGGYRANVPAGCPSDFFDVNRWRLIGGQLEMSTSFGKSIATFTQVGPNGFQGNRNSDGARVTLTR